MEYAVSQILESILSIAAFSWSDWEQYLDEACNSELLSNSIIYTAVQITNHF